MHQQEKGVRARRIATFTVGGLVGLVAAVGLAQRLEAHEKWFYRGEPQQLNPAAALEVLPLSLSLVVVALTAVAWWAWRMIGKRSLIPGPESFGATSDGLRQFYRLVPLILVIHTAIPLLASGLQGQLFSPNNTLTGVAQYFVGVAQTGIALALFYGGMTRAAAVLLILLWLAGIGIAGLEPMLENSHYLGLAAFFYLAGRGPLAIDRLLFPALEPSDAQRSRALLAARIGLGIALIVVAFTEKLANPALAIRFLEVHKLNFTASLGLPMSDYTFAMCAGAVELLVGLWLLLGIFPRLIILIAWLPFNMTLTIFNWVELVGHLPFYGMLAVFLTWDPERHRNFVLAGFSGSPTDRDGNPAHSPVDSLGKSH